LNIKQVLKQTNHRPWPMPAGRWKFYQEWNNALFLHWKVSKEVLEQWVPAELEIDTHDDTAYVSVVLFEMNSIRPRMLPAVGSLSNFYEVNIRTYVKYGGKTGVYFLNIEASSWLFCEMAKMISGLPYQYADIQKSEGFYTSINTKTKSNLKATYEIGSQVTEKSGLDLWLTERYALFQEDEKYINQFELHHLEWEIHNASLNSFQLNYPVFNSILHGKPHLVQFSSGVKVAAWGRERFRRDV
jgi:uncharacterized protein YqjF (DUF2071 family)